MILTRSLGWCITFGILTDSVQKRREGGGEGFVAGDKSQHRKWMKMMSIRFHIMAASESYVPSFVSIGDAFFYGRSGLPRYGTVQYGTVQRLILLLLDEW